MRYQLTIKNNHMLKNIGSTELIIVGLVLFLLFGGKKLPELTRNLTDSIREFRKSFSEDSDSKEKKEKKEK